MKSYLVIPCILLLGWTIQSDAGNAGFVDGQCVIDNPSRLFTDYIELKGSNTPDACKRACSLMKKPTIPISSPGFAIAGVQHGSECFCGQSILTLAVSVPASDCNLPCPGNKNLICGGDWRMNVYSTGITAG